LSSGWTVGSPSRWTWSTGASTRSPRPNPDDSFSDELLTLLNVGSGRDGEVTSEEILKLYENDRRLLLRDIKATSEQEISWRQSAAEATAAGNREVAEACIQEATAWEATVETLRRALRATIDPNKP
jgi:hypothetical protein